MEIEQIPTEYPQANNIYDSLNEDSEIDKSDEKNECFEYIVMDGGYLENIGAELSMKNNPGKNSDSEMQESNDQLVCDVCMEHFTTLALLEDHITHHENQETMFFCQYCHMVFQTQDALENHEKSHTDDKENLMKTLAIEIPFSCMSCGKKFKIKHDLNFHKCRGTPDLDCKVCGKKFARLGNLKQHAMKHTGEKPFSCNFCPKKFTCNSYKLRHLKQHTNGATYKCQQCPKEYLSEAALSFHMKKHSDHNDSESYVIIKGKSGTIYKCQKCPKEYKSEGGMWFHMKKHSEHDDSESHVNAYKCRKCPREYKSEADLSNHETVHLTDFPCDQCGITYKHAESLKNHKKSDMNHIWICEFFCSNVFANKNDLQSHMDSHKDEKPYKCTSCQKSFSEIRLKEIHEKRMHVSPQDLTCKICDIQFRFRKSLANHDCENHEVLSCEFFCKEKFTSILNLKDHIASHSDEKPYACDFCPSRFNFYESKKRHEEAKHTSGKPYKCGLCPKAFARKDSLEYHEPYHSGIKKFACRSCPKELYTETARRKHEKIHLTEFPCNQCGIIYKYAESLKNHEYGDIQHKFICEFFCSEVFENKDDLQNHIHSHAGEKPYKCEFCPKRFVRKDSCQVHKRRHLGDTPFLCKQCPMRFVTQGFLNSHVKIHKRNKMPK